MPTAVVDGITTRYEVAGYGPPLLMFSPGGFDSTLESWRTVGIYRRLDLLDHLSQRYTCITFDRRESGRSGGRVERVGFSDYVAQGRGLLDHLGIGSAYLMGGCVGCSTVVAFGVAHPDRVRGMVLFSPAGGVKYRMKQHARFRSTWPTSRSTAWSSGRAGAGLGQGLHRRPAGRAVGERDPHRRRVRRRVRHDRPRSLRVVVGGLARLLFDRDTVPGAEPEDLLQLDVPALIVPGQDESHAPSAARYLQECLPRAEYWDVPVAEQTAQTAPPRILEFLDACEARG